MRPGGDFPSRVPTVYSSSECALVGATRLKSEKGSTLLEFALSVLLFMTLMFGIYGFSLAMYAYHFVAHAAREGARYAAVHGYTCNNDAGGGSNGSCSDATPDTGPADSGNTVIQDFVNAIVPLGIVPGNVTVTPTWPVEADSPTICGTAVAGYAGSPYPNYPGCTVKVQVNYNFTFVFPLITKATIPLSSSSEMIITH